MVLTGGNYFTMFPTVCFINFPHKTFRLVFIIPSQIARSLQRHVVVLKSLMNRLTKDSRFTSMKEINEQAGVVQRKLYNHCLVVVKAPQKISTKV